MAGIAVALTACGATSSESSPQNAASAASVQPQVNLGQQLARGSWRIAETCPELRARLVRRGLAGAASLFVYPLFNHRPTLKHLCRGRLFSTWGYQGWTRRFFGGARAGVVGMNDPHLTYYEEDGYSVVGQHVLNLATAGRIEVTFTDNDTIVFRDQVTSQQIRRMLKNPDRPSPVLQALLFSYSGAPWVRVTGDRPSHP